MAVDPMTPEDEYVSFLPLAWIGEQMIAISCGLTVGFTLNFPEEPETVRENLREIGPQVMFSPPRIYENRVSEVQVKIEDTTRLKRRLYDWAMAVGYEMADTRFSRQAPSAALRWKYRLAACRDIRATPRQRHQIPDRRPAPAGDRGAAGRQGRDPLQGDRDAVNVEIHHHLPGWPHGDDTDGAGGHRLRPALAAPQGPLPGHGDSGSPGNRRMDHPTSGRSRIDDGREITDRRRCIRGPWSLVSHHSLSAISNHSEGGNPCLAN